MPTTHPLRRSARPLLGRLLVLTLTAGALAALPVGAATAADAVDGAQTSGDVLFPHVGNGGYDAQDYDIDLAWTPGTTLAQSTIQAQATMSAVTTGASLRTFSMDLEGLVVDSITVDGRPATWTRTDDAESVTHKLVVTPATPVDGAFTTVVAYHGTPSAHQDADGSLEGWNVTADGATFLNQPVGAMTGFPHNNTPSDKATWTFALDIPSELRGGGTTGVGPAAAVSNGNLVSRTPSADGTRTTWLWEQPHQMASELSLISIGRYTVYEDQITLASGRVLPEWTFIDPAVSARNLATTLATRDQQKSIIDGLETVFGPYPGASTGLVVDLVPGGINYALETQDRSFFPSRASLSTTVHEITHQWWGDAVSPLVWNDIWINEGMATWAESYYPNEISGTGDSTTEDDFYGEWADVPADDSAWTIPPAGMTDSADLFDFQTYSRGSMMWEALKGSIGDDDFFTFVRAWQDRYSGQSHGVDDFIALAEEISGRDLTAFFADWIYDADKPAWPATFDLDLVADPDGGTVDPGQSISYTATVTNTGKVPMTDSVVALDLTDVLDDATLDPTLPAGVTRRGRTLTWTVPTTEVGQSATTSVSVTVDADASDATIAASADGVTLGSTCGSCSVSSTVERQDLALDTPTITGKPQVGLTLVADPGEGAEPQAFVAYQWLRDGEDITSAVGQAYTVRPADLGHRISVRAVASRGGFTTTSRVSEPTSVVTRGVQTRTPTPRITGRAVVGGQLRAVAGTYDDGVSLKYRWKVGGKVVAFGPTMAVRSSYAGKRALVVVVAAKSGYRAERSASSRTGVLR